MRFTVILAVAAILTPGSAHRASGRAPQADADRFDRSVSAAKKKKKAPAKPKEEYLKAAPGTGPSGPTKILGRLTAPSPRW